MVRETEPLTGRVRARPWRTAALVVAVIAAAAYATLLRQELFLVVWLLFAGFFAHLALRFVRATERLASAAERLADASD